MKRPLISLLIAMLLFSVALAQKKKKYEPPAIAAPTNLDRDAGSAQPDPQSLADLKWFEVFGDEKLQALVREALISNFDVRASIARIEAAQANLGIVRSDQFPTIGANGEAVFEGRSRDGSLQIPDAISKQRNFGSVLLNLFTWELDIWGKNRKATQAARSDLAATEEDRRAVLTTIISDVATAYYNLRELDFELDIAKRTLKSRQDSLHIIKLRQERGVSNMLEVRQAEELVYDATETIPNLEKTISQQENFICVLIGKNPGTVIRGEELTAQVVPPDVPAGLSSELLVRRPDIRSAEQQLYAADARVDVARKAYFPTISLTGFFGFESAQLSSLFNPSRSIWGFIPQIAQPIFTGGRLKSNVRFSRAEQNLLLVNYEKTIQTAFREVADSLVEYRKLKEVRGQRVLLTETLRDRSRLSYLRYREGVANLLEALDADRELFDSERSLAQVRRDELLSVVKVYKSLGGGWQ
jgi:multidrug efflux system outer membrane protein